MIHAVCSHGYVITVGCGVTINVEPIHEMEKVLFAADELTGLIGAAALMRPSKSTKDMELKKTNPFVESNIFRSMENVNLDTVIEYKKDGVRHHFLDNY